MIKETPQDSINLTDNLDDLISLLNSKHVDLPNKVKLKPIKVDAIKRRKKEQYDEEIKIEEDFTTQKSSKMAQPEEFIKTHEKFYSTTTSSNTHKLNRIRRNLVQFPMEEEEEVDKTLQKPNKAKKKRKEGNSKSREKKERGDSRNVVRTGTKKFNIRKLKKKFKGPLNLVTSNTVPPQLENFKKARRALDDNRLATSKHVLIKTFNRYMSNPTMFIKNSGGFKDLVHLNSNFDDPTLAANLFRTGTDTYSRTIE